MKRQAWLIALLLCAAAPALRAEKSLQEQLDALNAEIKYIRDNYERSEPVEIVKPVTEFVSPSGEIFTTPQKDGVSPTDGSKLEERVTYRKMKFNRRESVNDKIDSAVSAAIDGHVVVGMELVGIYQNSLGVGDVIDATGQTRSGNRGWGTGGVNFNLSGKPMRNTLIFADFDASTGAVGLGEAWVMVQGPKKVLSLQAGVVDLTGSFDANKVANDETAQFMQGDFVNNALLLNPGTGPGAIVRVDFTRYNFMVGTQDSLLGSMDLFDNLYWIGEAGMIYNLLGDGRLRVWGRQLSRGSQQPDQAVGVSADHRLTTKLTAFGRYAKNSYVEAFEAEYLDAATATLIPETPRVALNIHDWTASGGLELGYFNPYRLHDKIGLAYGRTDYQGMASEQFAEVYIKTVLTPNFTISLHGQGTFSRTVQMSPTAALDPTVIDPVTGLPGDPTLNDALLNTWIAGIRTQISY